MGRDKRRKKLLDPIWQARWRSRSERADGEEAQVKLGVAAFVPQPLQREVEGAAQVLILLAQDEADALPEEAAFEIRAAGEVAAAGRVGTAHPKREAKPVA